MAAGEVRPRRPRNTSLISSMSKNNYGESADMADSLTYKDAGVDIDAGSELVKRIAKMAPGIGGFGGLFPLGTLLYGFHYLLHWGLKFLNIERIEFQTLF